jgi:hypothetical protein
MNEEQAISGQQSARSDELLGPCLSLIAYRLPLALAKACAVTALATSVMNRGLAIGVLIDMGG